MNKILLFTIVFICGIEVQADVRSLDVLLENKIEVSKWMNGDDMIPRGEGAVNSLAQLKNAQLKGDLAACSKWSGLARKQAASLKPWIAYNELKCALKSQSKLKSTVYLRVISEIDKNIKWLLVGAHRDLLRKVYIKVHFHQFEQSIKKARSKAWGLMAKLQEFESWLDKGQRAKLYRLGGELSFVQQNLGLAQNYFFKSLGFKESKKLRNKLNALKDNLPNDGLSKGKVKKAKGTNFEVEASEREQKIFGRMKQSLRTGDLVSAVDDGMKILIQFPGGVRAKWASKRIIDSFVSVAGKTKEEYRLLNDRIFNLITEASGHQLYAWSRRLVYKGHYSEALKTSEVAAGKLEGQEESSQALLISGRSAHWIGEYQTAMKHYQALVEKHSGTESSKFAMLQLGLLYLRFKKNSEASGVLEKLVASTKDDVLLYKGLYWLWRSKQKMSVKESESIAKRLIREFPLTYYGLRANAELNKGKLSWPQEGNGIKGGQLWLTSQENLAWERLQILLKAGWLDEASYELKNIQIPKDLKGKLAYAKIAASSLDYFSAITVVSQIWEEDKAYISPQIVRLVYPRAFLKLVNANADDFELDPDLIHSLIRQESSFRTHAVSPAKAAGLMQLMPLTAKESAKFIKRKGSLQVPEDLFEPGLNIQLGSHYLARMLKAFDGNLPFALAAYNAGIGNMRRWNGKRKEIKRLVGSPTSKAHAEIWIDELPWLETTDYVKAVLRNLLIYRLIDQNKYSLEDPIWLKSPQS